ncbi:hypothetical protein LXL04_003016 [Taraxacum kok-saghyz]
MKLKYPQLFSNTKETTTSKISGRNSFKRGDNVTTGSHGESRSTLEVPIFCFIQSEALLVDKHYQSKALSDMVIVIQSESSSWEIHLQCNGQSLLWDLRRPIKAALGAVSKHIAGLLPLHLIYSQAHEIAIEDWIWSVGCNPYSMTSQAWHVSQFQSDTIGRSYLLTTLEESIQQVNSAIHRLLIEPKQSYKGFQVHERHLVDKYKYVVNRWKRISTVEGELRYVEALRLLPSLEDASKGQICGVCERYNIKHAPDSLYKAEEGEGGVGPDHHAGILACVVCVVDGVKTKATKG